ncbi:MAG: FAD-dependent oxidoreductase [Acetobacteraceae bacterium SCN 69-10]|nr:MAG: FAD-dependent oxidoreductase [Acetobacteraceae bacterium SCN 69-10]OJY64812.1 MAG: FAD-dependent oxidoreductase [Rhodospirillales bacterium 70-18]
MTQDDATQHATDWLQAFADALRRGDIAAAAGRFAPDGHWRDLVAFTWNIATFDGPAGIAAMLADTLAHTAPANWAIDGAAERAEGVTQAWLTFETAAGRGRGHLRLRDGRCWTLLTALRELKGFEERQGLTREEGVQHGAFKHRRTWQETRAAEAAALGATTQPYVLVVGGGQGGIGLGARLKRLGVPALILDRHPRPGDAWRRRYKSLCLHDPVWYDHMPYLPFPEHWPVYTPKDKLGDWLEMYTRVMELDYWGGTKVRHAAYDEAAGEWTVTALREGREVTLRPQHLVLATGMSGVPNLPRYKGMERFAGLQHHSSRHPGGEGFAGKKCVVIGSNNSAHDICADLWEHDADVTMVQRSATTVIRAATLRRLGMAGLYSEAALARGITTDIADLSVANIPYALAAQFQIPATEQIRREDAAFYERLAAAGFMLDFGEDGSGLSMKYLRRGSGYYIDVGASELIMNGGIKLRSGVEVAEVTATGVLLNDGSELAADLIVYATGYGSMNGWAAELISPEVADRVGMCWGLGSGTARDPGPWEGELRNMWKPTRQPGLWFHGGNLAQSRHYSRYLALQLKARMEGLATPVHALAPVHHTG